MLVLELLCLPQGNFVLSLSDAHFAAGVATWTDDFVQWRRQGNLHQVIISVERVGFFDAALLKSRERRTGQKW